MAVEVKYVVVRNGEEKMTFANKKEADAYDKMLDLADSLGEWLQQAPVTLEEEQRARQVARRAPGTGGAGLPHEQDRLDPLRVGQDRGGLYCR